jgi:hypothetical protein
MDEDEEEEEDIIVDEFQYQPKEIPRRSDDSCLVNGPDDTHIEKDSDSNISEISRISERSEDPMEIDNPNKSMMNPNQSMMNHSRGLLRPSMVSIHSKSRENKNQNDLRSRLQQLRSHRSKEV